MLVMILHLVLVPALVIALGYGVQKLATRLVSRRLLTFWSFPGVIVHELSHAAACYPALAEVKRIALHPSQGRGEVVHSEPRLRWVGPVLISFAPLAGGLAMLFLCNWLLGNPMQHLTLRGNAVTSPGFIWEIMRVSGLDLRVAFQHANWLSWRTWAMLYIGVSLTLTMMPSKQDLKNAMLAVAAIIGVLLLLWLVLVGLLGMGTNHTLRELVTRVLGLAHIAIFYYALDVLLLLLLAGIGQVFGIQRKGKQS